MLTLYRSIISCLPASSSMTPQIALLGAGIFVRTQYIPRLRELADYVVVKTIWSRSEVRELFACDVDICAVLRFPVEETMKRMSSVIQYTN